MARVKAARTVDNEGKRGKQSSFIVAALLFMVIALMYVWCHIQITGLKYEIAEEVKCRGHLVERNKQLKVQLETLMSPGRIEKFARITLKMQYPERDQVIVLK